MNKVIFSPQVEEYLVELVDILYQKKYFGFKESAVQYVRDLVQDTVNNLPLKQKR